MIPCSAFVLSLAKEMVVCKQTTAKIRRGKTIDRHRRPIATGEPREGQPSGKWRRAMPASTPNNHNTASRTQRQGDSPAQPSPAQPQALSL